MRQKAPCVYIMASRSGTLYVGVTSDIHQRVWQHKFSAPPTSFAGKYKCNRLVYFGEFSRMDEAIAYEKYLKGKKRDFKIARIEEINPDWLDLASDWYE